MRWRPQARWVVLACDLPLVDGAAVEWLISRAAVGRDAVVPRLGDDAPGEPLFAIYEPVLRPRLEAAARRGTRSLQEILVGERISRPTVPASLREAWTNVNTPEQWDTVRREGPDQG
jgi:molybdopterin-guanine dinucleotide biosynthesis protein A